MRVIFRAKITHGGRIVIPAEMRKKLGVETGDDVYLMMENDELKISTTWQALRRIREAVKPCVAYEGSIVDELIAERRKEAENE